MRPRIVGVKINKKMIDKKVSKARSFEGKARKKIQQRLKRSKKELLKEFDNHPVTKELEAGPDAQNYSGTLGGYGNLFSFMGFGEGMDPTRAVRNFLESSIVIKGRGKVTGTGLEITIKTPTIQDFDFAKMPWESGNSWVRSVEVGMSSFSYYMHKAYEAARSGAGIQIDNKLRKKSSKGVSYMRGILRKFRKKLGKK